MVLAVGLVFLFGYLLLVGLVGLALFCVAVIVVWCFAALFDLLCVYCDWWFVIVIELLSL